LHAEEKQRQSGAERQPVLIAPETVTQNKKDQQPRKPGSLLPDP